MPAAAELLRIFGVHFRAENVRRLADADDITDIRPHSGVQPGEEMGRMLERAHRWRLAGIEKEDVMRQLENSFRV